MKKEFEVIEISKDLSVVVDREAEIKFPDFYADQLFDDNTTVHKCMDIDYGNFHPKKELGKYKIIATIGQKLEGVPMVVVEDEVIQAAKKYCMEGRGRSGHDFSNGYKAAREKWVYSLQDVIDFVQFIGELGWYYEKGKNRWVHDDETGCFNSTEDLVKHYIEPYHPKPIKSVVLEMDGDKPKLTTPDEIVGEVRY